MSTYIVIGRKPFARLVSMISMSEVEYTTVELDATSVEDAIRKFRLSYPNYVLSSVTKHKEPIKLEV